MTAVQISGEMVVYNTKPLGQLQAKIKIKSHFIQYPLNLKCIKNFLLN